jgi:hypothetical protein
MEGINTELVGKKSLGVESLWVFELGGAMNCPCIGEKNGAFWNEVSVVMVIFCYGVRNPTSGNGTPT